MKSTNIIITIIVLILIAGGVYAMNMNKVDEPIMMKDDAMMEKEMMQSDKMMMKDETVMVKSGMYTMYSPDKLSTAEAGDVVLFFKASWCPSCRAVDADIKANMSNIPETLTILELDYDASSDLKKKYGVTTQHTFVQVDSNGNMIKKWSGGSTLNSIVQEII